MNVNFVMNGESIILHRLLGINNIVVGITVNVSKLLAEKSRRMTNTHVRSVTTELRSRATRLDPSSKIYLPGKMK